MIWSLKNGTTEGMCPFTVYTLTNEEYNTANSETLKALAAKHLDDGGKILAIGHSQEPQSIWKNPKLYLKCFHGFFHMVLVGLAMKSKNTNYQMQSTSDTF